MTPDGHIRATRIDLQSGSVDITATPLKVSASRSKVQTPRVVTTVRGTHFRVVAEEEISRHEVLALVRGDARLLQRALLNLGWNALRHGPTGSVVSLSLTQVDGGFEIAVHDEGTGFPAEALAALVGSNTQGNRASASSGYGLG